MFKECYPEVYEIIRIAKSKEKSTLALLLQTIESEVIIDRCCKRVSKEHPDRPIWTIHDSISTTKNHIDYIKQVMQEEFKAVIGIAPKLEITNWKSYEG